MKAWILIAALLGACTSPTSTPQSEIAPQANPPGYEDARSSASDAEIRMARRAYRDACLQSGGAADRCECMTASMAQRLAPGDLAVATAQLNQNNTAHGANLASVNAARVQAEAACAQYRR